MKKKIVVATILAALVAIPVFAATTAQIQPQNERFDQMLNNHQQMVQQAVDNGTMTTDQANKMNEHMQQAAPVMQQMMQNGGMMNGNKMSKENMMHSGNMMSQSAMMGTPTNNN